MTELILLLEVFKFFLMFYGLYRAYKQRQKEKALVKTLTELNQRLSKLEDAKESKKLDD